MYVWLIPSLTMNILTVFLLSLINVEFYKHCFHSHLLIGQRIISMLIVAVSVIKEDKDVHVDIFISYIFVNYRPWPMSRAIQKKSAMQTSTSNPGHKRLSVGTSLEKYATYLNSCKLSMDFNFAFRPHFTVLILSARRLKLITITKIFIAACCTIGCAFN